jgi:CTP:molybdopterin cytidylyltransferase MocA
MMGVSPQLVAVVLAAGSGSRMGGICKARLLVGDRSLLELQIDALEGAGVTSVIVVCRSQLRDIEQLVGAIAGRRARGMQVASVVAEDDAQITSVRAGLLAVRELMLPDDARVLLTLVDLPLANAASLRHLLDHPPRGQPVVLPVSPEGQRGHPLCMTFGFLKGLPLSYPDFSLRNITDPAITAGIETMASHDPAYFTDVDTPEHLDAMACLHGIHIRRPDVFDTVGGRH